ncbi:MAG: hypothetical protein H3C43_07575, partial [Leptonema sp. (in: Bacteria)]|nr:hypothetical protein [Leptonema sp. (in: bacteria)]
MSSKFENESQQEPAANQRKKISIRLGKLIQYQYLAEEKRLVQVHSTEADDYSLTFEMVLNAYNIKAEPFVNNLLEKFHPESIADRMVKLLEKDTEKDFHQALDRAEYDVVRLSASQVIGSDDEPSRIYKFLGDILKIASKRM